jgi:hypothetical protein
MPAKGHRVAAHQARLRNRRKYHAKGPSGIPNPPPSPLATEDKLPKTSSTLLAVPQLGTSPKLTPHARPIVHNFIKPELARIAVLGATMLIALISLSIILG